MSPREQSAIQCARALTLCALAREEVATSRNHRNVATLRRHLTRRRHEARP